MKALIAAVSVVGLLLVGACGVQASGPVQTKPENSYKQIDFIDHPAMDIWVICKGKTMYVISDGNRSGSAQRIDNHEECK